MQHPTCHSSCHPRWHCCESHSSHALRTGSRNPRTITAFMVNSTEFTDTSGCIQKHHLCIGGALHSQNNYNYLLRFCNQFKHLHPWHRISFQQLNLIHSFQIQLLKVWMQLVHSPVQRILPKYWEHLKLKPLGPLLCTRAQGSPPEPSSFKASSTYTDGSTNFTFQLQHLKRQAAPGNCFVEFYMWEKNKHQKFPARCLSFNCKIYTPEGFSPAILSWHSHRYNPWILHHTTNTLSFDLQGVKNANTLYYII